MRTARSFDEAIVRLKSATIQDGVYDPGSVAKWEGNTQKGGANYKEYLLRLPPKGESGPIRPRLLWQMSPSWLQCVLGCLLHWLML